jgi:pimeloyl-ACP methyl ester carboxylesterase
MSEFKKELFVRISAIAIISLLLTISSRALFNLANGQTSPCDNGTIIRSTRAFPVILIHGYAENSGIWSQWEQLLTQNSIPFCTVSFHQPGDECGSAVSHANQLGQIIQKVKSLTGQNQVNIAAHSKGGLDARVYLASSGTSDIANLIMIGTPNAGDPLADLFHTSDQCKPAVFDLETGAPDTMASKNTHTNYYTIAGECLPFLELPFPYGIVIPESNDGIVPLSSVESLPYSTSLGHTLHCHLDLLSDIEYGLAQPVLLAR